MSVVHRKLSMAVEIGHSQTFHNFGITNFISKKTRKSSVCDSNPQGKNLELQKDNKNRGITILI
jgi:hypothetical protein